MNGASLAACQKDAFAPARVGIAIHIVSEVAGFLKAVAVRGKVTPDNIFIRYDGVVELRAGAPPKIGYSAPEQIKGGAVDQRADVFVLGVVLWELLTATALFERDSPMATRVALLDEPLLDVRDVNPEVPAIVSEVLATALQRDKALRFDTVGAFCKALMGAAATSGIAVANASDIKQWVTERVPLASGAAAVAPDLAMPTPAPVPAPVAMAAVPDLDIPAFDTNAMAAEALRPSQMPPAAISAPPPSSRGRALPRVSSSPSLPDAPSLRGSSATPKAVAFDPGSDDDEDMEIERNVAGSMMPMSTSSRGAGPASRPSSGSFPARRGGLELDAPSRMQREGARDRSEDDGEPGTGIKIAGLALASAIAGGTAFALWKYMHHAGGIPIMRLLPHAFDGTSAPESGAVSLVALVVAMTLGFIGLRFKPRAWAIVACGGVTLLLALAMVTVTLGSTGENPTPPDGALLVPYLFPAIVLLLGLGSVGRAGRLFAVGGIGRRLAVLPVAAIAGGLAFFAFEVSHFAH